jgi:peptide/nickel transport system ATP-binding protein
MYAGRIAEVGPLRDVVRNPKHPYTVGLMNSIPTVAQEKEELPHIPGAMPRLHEIPLGCAFNPRCSEVFHRCRVERPDLLPTGQPRQQAACWKYDGKRT